MNGRDLLTNNEVKEESLFDRDNRIPGDGNAAAQEIEVQPIGIIVKIGEDTPQKIANAKVIPYPCRVEAECV